MKTQTTVVAYGFIFVGLLALLLLFVSSGCVTGRRLVDPQNRPDKQVTEDANQCARNAQMTYSSAREQLYWSCMGQNGYTFEYY